MGATGASGKAKLVGDRGIFLVEKEALEHLNTNSNGFPEASNDLLLPLSKPHNYFLTSLTFRTPTVLEAPSLRLTSSTAGFGCSMAS